MTEPGTGQPAVRRASVEVLRIFDAAYGIDLAGVERILQGRAPVARIRLQRVEPKAIAFDDPPVVTDLVAPALEVGGRHVATRASARIYSFGVVSLSLEVKLPAPLPWAEFETFAREAEREAAGLPFWRSALDSLLDALRGALDGPTRRRMEEDYTVVTVRELDPPLPAAELQRRVDLVPLLTHESRPMAEPARRDVLRHAHSYYQDDLVVLTCDRAFILEPWEDDDVADVLEVANAQLLELRYYDALLDDELPRMYALAAAVRVHRSQAVADPRHLHRPVRRGGRHPGRAAGGGHRGADPVRDRLGAGAGMRSSTTTTTDRQRNEGYMAEEITIPEEKPQYGRTVPERLSHRVTLNVPSRSNPKLAMLIERINADDELYGLWTAANVNAVERLGMTDHGPVHVKIVMNIGAKLLRLLVEAGVEPGVVTNYGMEVHDAEVVVALACLFHDLGMSISRKDHEAFSLFVAQGKIRELLADVYDVGTATVIRSEVLHAIIAHRAGGRPLTLEAGIVRVADALDMAKGRSRIPMSGGSMSIHSISAAAIEAVHLEAGQGKPIRLRIEMSNSAGVFQLDQLFREKLSGSGLEPYVEVEAHIEGEGEKRLFTAYRL